MRARIAVVDDRPLIRAGLSASLGVPIVGEYTSVAEAKARLVTANPTVTIVRSILRDGSGLELCRALRGTLPGTRTCILFASPTRQDLIAAIDAGAAYLCAEDVPISELRDVVTKLNNDVSLLSGASLARLGSRLSPVPDQALVERYGTLSPRQHEIAELVGTGASNDAIAKEIGLATQTVKNQLSAILANLGLDNRTQLAVFVASRSAIRR